MTGTGLEVTNLTVSFDAPRRRDSLEAFTLRKVSFALARGDVLAVLGPSGSGKSTLLRAIAGLERVESGCVRWDGEDLTSTPVHRRGFALMFQDGQLFAHRSVGANIGYPLSLRGVGRTERHATVAELLELVGLADFSNRRITDLSGGEQQRVALARVLAARPRLLLLDEPLSSLDRALRDRLARELRQILRRTGTTAMFVTHDPAEADVVANTVGEMVDGEFRIVDGHPADC